MNRRWWLIWCVFAVLLVQYAWFNIYDHDEIEHLHAAWLLSEGHRPFVDFCEQHHPTVWYLLAPLASRIRDPHLLVFCARLFDLVYLGALILLVRTIARRVHPTADARWAMLLAASSFIVIRKMVEVRPDPLMNALVYAGLASWIAFLDERRMKFALGAGLAFGLAIAVLQKALAIVGLVGAAALAQLWLRRDDRPFVRSLVAGGALLVVAAVPPVIALGVAMDRAGVWRDFWFWNYTFNRFFYITASLPQQFSTFNTLGQSLLDSPPLWVLAGAAVVARARALRRDREPKSILLLVLAVGYLVFLLFNRFPLLQYYIPLLPLLAVLALGTLERLDQRRARLARSTILVVAAVAAVRLVVHSYTTVEDRVHARVLAGSAPDAAVAISPPHHPIFRRDASFFWYNGVLIGQALGEYCARYPDCPRERLTLEDTRWNARPPRFVFLHWEFDTYHPFRWSERQGKYKPTDLDGLLIRDE